MPQFEVEPGQLASGATVQADVAGRVLEAMAELESGARQVIGASGSEAASGSLEGCALSWSASLALLADSVARTAVNLEAASEAYTGTDRGAIPR